MKLTPASSPLTGAIAIPGDKSISHRAVMFGALAERDTAVTHFLMGAPCLSTIGCFRAMGVKIEVNEGRVLVHGSGLHGLKAPASDLDCGNSGTTMRLIMGILAAQPFKSKLTGDDSLKTRPMGRVAKPLREMGACIESETPSVETGKLLAPLLIAGTDATACLHGITYESPVASAQVKSAILLAGLYADSPTTVLEPAKSRDHTERMLSAFGAKIETGLGGAANNAAPGTGSTSGAANNAASGAANDATPGAIGTSGAIAATARVAAKAAGNSDPVNLPFARIYPCQGLTGQSIHVPGDISSAAYFLAAASLVPGSELVLKNVGVNPTRDGFLRVLKAMGGDFELQNLHEEGGEPCADILVHYAPLHGTIVEGDIIPTLIDELPMVAVMAACAEGETIVKDAAELAVKESNRIKTVAEGLRAMGADIEERPDGWVIRGKAQGSRQETSQAPANASKSGNTAPADVAQSLAGASKAPTNASQSPAGASQAPASALKGAVINSYNDHRIAMSFAIASLIAEGETEILNSDCISISYPAFFSDLEKLFS